MEYAGLQCVLAHLWETLSLCLFVDHFHELYVVNAMPDWLLRKQLFFVCLNNEATELA